MENATINNVPKKSFLPVTVFLVVVVVGVSVYFVMRPGFRSGDADTMKDNKVLVTDEPQPTSVEQSSPPTGASEVRAFTVVGTSFAFSPSEIKVKKGDRVKITFQNADGMHDWVLDEFNARTPRIQAGQTADVEFIANKTGTFEYYCSVGSHRAMGMHGNLIVE